ncbi:MAG TPA: type II toxin-antitoxin system VapC family toxin [Rhodanobacter sp.]|nr:type II toxin-antitoxin system VapC family toxin [Rhodanobacter sp.]
MIHFDTNALIALPQWAREGHAVVRRVLDGEAVAVCAVVWYEYLLGPLADGEAELAHAFISGRVESISEADATLGAELFNAAGRRRTLKTDALIAATAIRAGADFVTANVADFKPFAEHGLRLIPAEA